MSCGCQICMPCTDPLFLSQTHMHYISCNSIKVLDTNQTSWALKVISRITVRNVLKDSNKNRNRFANIIEAFENMENVFRLTNFLENSKLVQNWNVPILFYLCSTNSCNIKQPTMWMRRKLSNWSMLCLCVCASLLIHTLFKFWYIRTLYQKCLTWFIANPS